MVETVHDRLKQAAMELSVEPGRKVKEGVLAAEFSVSRTPVREALNRLVTEGFMTFTPNRGFFCRDIDLREISQLYEGRAALEVWAFRKACDFVPEEGLANIWRDWFAFVWQHGQPEGPRSRRGLGAQVRRVALGRLP